MFDDKAIQKAKEMIGELAAAGAFEHTHSAYRFHQWEKAHCDKISFEFTVSSGCFKIVIIPKNFDFVIKTAITAGYSTEDEETIERQHKNLNGPYAELRQWYLIYGSDFEKYFLETQYLMTFGEHEFFIQPKAQCDEYAITESLRSYVDIDDFEDEEELDEYVTWDYSTEELLCSLWGDDEGMELYEYLYEADITDIHKGNIGRYHDQWVIIDYAS